MTTEIAQDSKQPTTPALASVNGSAAVEREKRQWWAVDSDDDDVKLVTGYSCAPNSPTYWWIPQLGASMPVGFTLFETEREALDKAIEKLERKITIAQDNIEALKRRRQNNHSAESR